MRTSRAPRSKKRISCEFRVGGSRYAGIVLDLSATGMWVQTNAKLSQTSLATRDAPVRVTLSVPGGTQSVTVDTRLARMKIVPPQFLGIQHGGVGLALANPSDAYLEFVAGISPEQAAAVEEYRKSLGVQQAASRPAKDEPKRFRIHAVETSSGRKNTYIATSTSEDEAGAEVLAQLGDEWQVLFVERV